MTCDVKFGQNSRVRSSLHQYQFLFGAFGAVFYREGCFSGYRRAIHKQSNPGILSDLCSPEAPFDKTYGDLATILKDHFAPKKLLIAERYRFHNCIQLEGESVSTFATKLKYLASTCYFGTHLNEALRDRLVCGLRNGWRARSFTIRPPSRSISLSVFSMNAENNGIKVPVELNRIHLLMKLDTGAGVSIVSQETFNSSATQSAPSERSRVPVVSPSRRGLQQGKRIPLFFTCAGALQS